MSVSYTVDWVEPTPSLRASIEDFTDIFLKHWTRFAGNSMRYRNSVWPAKKLTANKGPYSKQVSVRRFSGKLINNNGINQVVIMNDAKNSSGVPYAYYGNRGVNSLGRVSSARFRANYDACYRTITKNQNRIGSFAMRAANREEA